MALAHHAAEGNEKGVLLCLWAGADPHAPVPSLRHPDLVDSDDDDQVESNDRFLGWTAIEEASSAGHVEILERLGPDPSRDNFDDLYSWADSSAVIELLARSALPKNVGEVVHRYISRFGMYRSDWTARERLRSLFQAGARWDSSGSEQITGVRRSLCKLSDENFVEVLKLLATDAYCSETILHELVGTPTMRARMKKVGFIPAPSDESKGLYQPRPTRSREVLAKCGIVLPKPVPRLPYIVEIGKWKSNEREIRLTRAELFERVWSEPVEKLAKEWGLSDRGLGKACRRLQIPVPSRGFWAKLQHEKRMRRPRLPDVKPGEAEQVLIHVPTPRDSDGEAESG